MSICMHGKMECRCPICNSALIDDMLDQIKALQKDVESLKLDNANTSKGSSNE